VSSAAYASCRKASDDAAAALHLVEARWVSVRHGSVSFAPSVDGQLAEEPRLVDPVEDVLERWKSDGVVDEVLAEAMSASIGPSIVRSAIGVAGVDRRPGVMST
jgi:hypothetical protein